jgi:hypothetical protein
VISKLEETVGQLSAQLPSEASKRQASELRCIQKATIYYGRSGTSRLHVPLRGRLQRQRAATEPAREARGTAGSNAASQGSQRDSGAHGHHGGQRPVRQARRSSDSHGGLQAQLVVQSSARGNRPSTTSIGTKGEKDDRMGCIIGNGDGPSIGPRPGSGHSRVCRRQRFEAAAGHEEEARHSAPAKGRRDRAAAWDRAGSGVAGARRLADDCAGHGFTHGGQLRGTEEGGSSHTKGGRSTGGMRRGGDFATRCFASLSFRLKTLDCKEGRVMPGRTPSTCGQDDGPVSVFRPPETQGQGGTGAASSWSVADA